jgi:hypothetical protein
VPWAPPDAARAAAIALALAGAALTGCGSAPRHATSASPTPPQVRWLVPTSGAPPSVAPENAARGSSAWRSGDRDTRGSGIDVYVSDQDVRPGDVVRIYVRARGQRSVRLRLFRIGWYGGRGGRLMAQTAALAVAAT